jgi:peroxiredoxin
MLFCFLTLQTLGETKPKLIGRKVNDFSLKNINGEMISLSSYPYAKGFVIIFTCNHCPFAKLYSSRFNKLADQYANKNIPVIAINGMDSLTYEEEVLSEMKRKAEDDKFNFPYLQDASQTVTRQFSAERTPQAYVIWKEQEDWIIKYAGAIDDNGAEPDKVKNQYVNNALEELIRNKPVSTALTSSIGCKIYLRK